MERSFDTLVAAIAILAKKYPDLHIHLFGPVRFVPSDASLLPNYNKVSRHLTFYGYTDLRTVLPYAARSLAGIALLKPVGDYPDSYTTKLFEYMALQLPVITSDFALYRNVVEQSECGFCISPYSGASLADKMEWIIENKSEASKMGQNGRTAVEKNYNWESEEIILLSFYKRVLGLQKTAA